MNLRFLELKSFCFCISLRTGAKFMGLVSLVGTVFLWIDAFHKLAIMSQYERYGFSVTLCTVDIVFQSVQIATSVSLLLGIYQEKAKLIPWWLASTIVLAVFEATLLQSSLWPFSFVVSVTDYMFYILILISLIDDVYGLVVVFSYYRTLTARQGQIDRTELGSS